MILSKIARKLAMWLGFTLFAPLALADNDRRIPEPQAVKDLSWRSQLDGHRIQIRRFAPLDVCFIGDSLTEYWKAEGATAWEAEFGGWKTINLGIAADRVEHIRFRIRQCARDFSQFPPRGFVLWLGTNNLGMEPPEAPASVVAAIGAAIHDLREAAPGRPILLLSLTPSGDEDLRRRIRETNRLLAQREAEFGVEFLDLQPHFAEKGNGSWKPGLTVDGTHLSAAGYELLATILKPEISSALAFGPARRN